MSTHAAIRLDLPPDKLLNLTLLNFLSRIGFVAAVAGIVALLSLGHLLARNPFLIGVQVMAALLMLWARRTFGRRSFHASASPTEGGLVTTGPYRYWRHPIYASIIYFVWAGQIEAPAVLPMLAAVVITLALLLRMLIEERFLAAEYPEYSGYARRAKRLVPFVY